jgi:uncharacterized protein YijF (DUF1287 family)
MEPRGSIETATVGLLAFALVCVSCDRGPVTAAAEVVTGEGSGEGRQASESSAVEPLSGAPTRIEGDDGIFSDLDEQIRLTFPDRFRRDRVVAVSGPGTEMRFAYIAGRPVGLAADDWTPATEVVDWRGADLDGDGIPNQLDILLGAQKAALNGADYKGGYEAMDYPGGDVPRSRGVCTDVVVRTLRNAGIDLQKRLHEDITADPDAYPMIETPDPNIDQRRVRTILPYFERHWRSLSADPDDRSTRWLPGDVVFMDTMDGPRPEHVGIVAAREGDSGYPLVINNWTNGYETAAMDLLGRIPVTHRFRLDAGRPKVPEAHRGLAVPEAAEAN